MLACVTQRPFVPKPAHRQCKTCLQVSAAMMTAQGEEVMNSSCRSKRPGNAGADAMVIWWSAKLCARGRELQRLKSA